MRILFQGDSITDAGRDKRNYFDLGVGYARFAAEIIKERHPDTDIEFINLGINGNRSGMLFDRIYPDAIALKPDVISILIGVNDVWHRHSALPIFTTDEQYELNYRTILELIRKRTDAKILIMSPFLLDSPEKQEKFGEEIKRIIAIAEKLAGEFADAYVPLYKYFDEALKTQPTPQYYSADGVHPNEAGARFIAGYYADAIEKLL
jgi:lysophospholipase L1-like esterase